MSAGPLQAVDPVVAAELRAAPGDRATLAVGLRAVVDVTGLGSLVPSVACDCPAGGHCARCCWCDAHQPREALSDDGDPVVDDDDDTLPCDSCGATSSQECAPTCPTWAAL